MTDTLLDEETEAIIAWLEGPPEMLAALRFRIRRLMDDARDDELEVEALRSNPPDSPDTPARGTPHCLTCVCAYPMPSAKCAEPGDGWPLGAEGDAEESTYDEMLARKDLEIVRLRKLLAERIPPSDSEELERVLETLERFVRDEGLEQFDSHEEWLAAYTAARKSVLDLFERLQNRIAELERSTSGA